MIQPLKIYDGPNLALEIIDGFTEADLELVQTWADAKREDGFERANVLLKVDQLKISETSAKAALEQILRLLKNFRQIGRLAIVGHSSWLKMAVPIDNFFFQVFSKGSEERYFDVTELDAAFAFIESTVDEQG